MIVIARRHLCQIQKRYDVVAALKLDRAAAQAYSRYVRNILISLWKRRMEYTSIIVRVCDRGATYFPDQKLGEVRRNARYSRNISLYDVIVYITGYAQRLMPRVNQGGRRVYQVNEFSYVERPSRSIVSYARSCASSSVSEAEVVADAVSRAANTPRTSREVIVAAAIAVTGSLFIAT